MEKQKLTFRQKVAYAHWSAKQIFFFPCVGEFIALIVSLIYTGLLFWFFETEVIDLLDYTGAYAQIKHLLGCFAATLVILIASFATVYIAFFIVAFNNHDESEHQYFIKYEYRKH